MILLYESELMYIAQYHALAVLYTEASTKIIPLGRGWLADTPILSTATVE